MRNKNKLAVIFALFVCFVTCGAGWFNTTKVIIDTESNPVYKYCTADEVLSEFSTDHNTAKENYQNSYILLSGKVVSVGANGKNITISGHKETSLTIDCTYDKAFRTTALNYHTGDEITLYGKISVDFFDKEIHLLTDKIVRMPSNIMSTEIYYLLDGSSFNKSTATKRTLHDGNVEFYIPPVWKEVEHDIEEENLGSIEGYQYVLNRLSGTSDPVPESLFVCYFNNKTQLENPLNDSGETELIEKAIIENILGSIGVFPSKKLTTYYDEEYVYYLGSFKNAFEAGAGYHTEFIFQADGEDGILLILYVYKEPKHLSDVLFLTRFLKVTEK